MNTNQMVSPSNIMYRMAPNRCQTTLNCCFNIITIIIIIIIIIIITAMIIIIRLAPVKPDQVSQVDVALWICL